MPVVSTTGITELLNARSKGDSSALETLTPLILHDLRRLAKHHLARERFRIVKILERMEPGIFQPVTRDQIALVKRKTPFGPESGSA
jgi:hypothetical protein